MKRALTIEIISSLLIVLFIYAALSKLFEYSLFVEQLKMHPLLKHFAGLLAWALPVTELAVATLLVISRTKLTGLYCVAVLLIVFTLYLIIMLLSDKDLPCSCGGVISSLSWRQHIVFNGVFILLAIIGIWLEKKRKIFYKGSVKKTQPVRTV